MKSIKFVNEETLKIKSIATVDGNLVIVVEDKNAEEVQEIFSDKANLWEIKVLTESGEVSSTHFGFVCYSSLSLSGKEKKLILTKETDKDTERISAALGKASVAEMRATVAESRAEQAETRVTELETENATLKEQQTEIIMQQQSAEVALTDVEIVALELKVEVQELKERIGE